MPGSTRTHVALAKIHAWITREGAGTDSAAVLRAALLSLAGRRQMKLLQLQVLDETRRGWLAEVIRGLPRVSLDELVSAAGGAEDAPVGDEADNA